jgi:hypothetical protein
VSSEASPKPSVFDQILAGGNREVQMLVAQGIFPLPPQELVPIQVALAAGDDEELAAAAGESLASLDPKIAASVVAESADNELMAYLGRVLEHPVVTEAIVRNRAVTAAVLGAIAPRLTPELQEILLLRQDLIVENPEILDHLESNADLSAYSERRILEYREHLVPVEEEPALDPASAEIAVEEGAEEATPEEVQAAIAAARLEPAEGERDEVTGLSEAQIRSLPVPVRMKLARGAPRSLRAILIKDKSSMVARAVLNGNALTESEIELVASNRSVAEEVLTMIAQNRQWNRKYNIIHALIKNPRTNVGMAVRLVSQLSIRDLRNLSRDRNVSEAVRNTAARLYRIKAV